MSDEKYYKVTSTITLTIQADTPDQAIDIAMHDTDVTGVGGKVRSVTTDRGLMSAELIEHDPEELAKMERWLDEVSPTHPFTD